MLTEQYYSNGKLLLTAEYLVLDGAKALALPTKQGQDLQVYSTNTSELLWESFDEKNTLWFSCTFSLPDLKLKTLSQNNTENIAATLEHILTQAQKLNSGFLQIEQGYHIKTNLTFPRNWGLGTSSTLINNIAQWAHISAFTLLKNSFGGSGYDIACAQNNTPISYQILQEKPIVKPVNFNPVFKNQLYFIYLNKKQNSKDAIAHYKNSSKNNTAFAEEISALTDAAIACTSITNFEKIMRQHEEIIASILNQKPIQQELFSGYFGQIKSLGAWGGDFILATGNEKTPNYFKNKGFTTIIPFQNMILCNKK